VFILHPYKPRIIRVRVSITVATREDIGHGGGVRDVFHGDAGFLTTLDIDSLQEKGHGLEAVVQSASGGSGEK
jgi:hypothetical protein